MKYFDKALQQEDFALAHYNKGITYCHQKQYKDASACFEQVLQMNPQFASAWFYQGYVWEKLGFADKAKSAYDKAKQLGYQSI